MTIDVNAFLFVYESSSCSGSFMRTWEPSIDPTVSGKENPLLTCWSSSATGHAMYFLASWQSALHTYTAYKQLDIILHSRKNVRGQLLIETFQWHKSASKSAGGNQGEARRVELQVEASRPVGPRGDGVLVLNSGGTNIIAVPSVQIMRRRVSPVPAVIFAHETFALSNLKL